MLCIGCKTIIVQKRGDMCKTCAPVASRRSRVREARLAGSLKLWASEGLIPEYTRWNRANPRADPVQSGHYRVDFVFEGLFHVVALEYDERMHSDRDQHCELVRMGRVSLGYQGKPVHWVRFNPDAFKVGGATQKTGIKEREGVLLRVLQAACCAVAGASPITIHYVCYDAPQGPGLVQTHSFETIEAYCAWVDSISALP